MRRQDKYPDTRTFHYHNENPRNRMTGDCAYRAVATATEKPWKQVVMEMAELACENGYSPSSKENINRYLQKNGWTKHKQPRKQDNTKYTGAEFCEVQQKWIGNEDFHGVEWGDGIIVSPRIVANLGGNHVVAIVDGKVNDIWNSVGGCIGNYWTK